MIFLISGSDTKKRIEVRDSLIKEYTNDAPLVSRINELDFSENAISGLVYEQSMFFEERAVILTDVLNDTNFDFLKNILSDMEKSEVLFIFEQDSVSTLITKSISKYAKDVFAQAKISKPKPKILGFDWAYAVLNKDKKGSWLILEQAVLAGSSAEELLGTLFWQIKIVLIVKKYENNQKVLAESEISPYSISQAKTLSKNWSVEDLSNLSSRLLISAQEGRRKGFEMKTVLEEFVLKI